MISWDDLRYILAVRHHGSLAAAAKALGQNKSTVSRRIAALEHALGVSLLVRKSSGYELTAAGDRATDTATKMERLANELVAQVGGVDLTQSGTVRVTVPAFFAQHVLIPEIPDLRERYPALDVHLLTTDDVLNLAQREADIGIRNVRPTQQSLISTRAGAMNFAMYAARAYVSKHGIPADREDFAGHALIAYERAVAHVEAYRWTNDLTCGIAFRAKDAVSMLDAVAAGLGIGVLPSFIAAGNRELVCVDSVGGPQPEQIWLVSHPDALKIVRVRLVFDWLKEVFERNAERLVGPTVGDQPG